MNLYFKSLLEKRRSEYKVYKPIYCRCLEQCVVFNSSGFNHLRFKVNGLPRNQSEQMYKLGLLPLVRPVIYSSKNIEKYERRFISVRKSVIVKTVDYWSLVATVGKNSVTVRVILRKVGDGKVHFWSVMKLSNNQKTPSKDGVV